MPENAPEYNFSLHDLSKDLGEKNDLSKEKPELVKTLNQRMEELDAEVEKNARPCWQKEQP